MNSHDLRPTRFVLRCAWLLATIGATAIAAEPPEIPVGYDAYRQWEKWPYQRIGARAYMRSTYDRRGGNEGADASHFLYQLADDFNVSLDVEGRGILYFARYNHWHGSPWHYVVDGTDHIVKETSTADPLHPAPNSTFIPANLFPAPLAWTWADTKGADLSWVPIPFEKSFRMAYSRTRYGTGYYIYHQYVRGAKLSQPLKAWDAQTPPDKEVMDLISKSGTDIGPGNPTKEISEKEAKAIWAAEGAERAKGKPDPPGSLSRAVGISNGKGPMWYVAADEQAIKKGVWKSTDILDELTANSTQVLFQATNAPSMLRRLTFSIPREQAVAFGRARLRIAWDGRETPSVDSPIALFFGTGTLYNRDNREYLVKAFPNYIRFGPAWVELTCLFPMPFFKSARIELIGATNESVKNISWTVLGERLDNPPSQVGYFHATYRDHPRPEPGNDMVLLDTREAEGGGNWSGSFVGTSFIFSERAVLNTLEGDPRFFFDDSQTPQAQGTGTEEWGGGGDYWGGRNMTLPFAGHPVGARNAQEAKNDEDKIESAYRFLLADLMPFGRNAVIRLEHGGQNESTEHYQTVTYWYGAPAASLVKTDELKVGDAASEQAHRYVSPQASAPYEITSRYEWGVDTLPRRNAPAFETPAANPKDFAEFEFQAEAGRKYYIWVRGANLDGSMTSDAFWMQFDQEIGTTKLGPTYNHTKGFGNWLDRFPKGVYAWSSALPQDPPQSITFATPGQHRLRIQPRHPKHNVEQIWLSTTQAELPDPGKSPVAGPGDIVLKATGAIKVTGRVKLVAGAKAGQVLEMNGDKPAARAARPEENLVVYPAHSDQGRKTTGTSEFTLKLQPDNFGVLLRRKLDYAFPNQRAEVFVANGGREVKASDWKPAGVWYLAGANTCIYSNPKEELGATQHNVQTSNRRFRDDEFLVPRDLTEGRSSIRVRVKFTPVNTPLFPGQPLAELAWSEIRYDTYCFVMPEWKAGGR